MNSCNTLINTYINIIYKCYTKLSRGNYKINNINSEQGSMLPCSNNCDNFLNRYNDKIIICNDII